MSSVIARRVGRLAFGATLIAGAATMIALRGVHSARVLEWTWLAAVAAWLVGRDVAEWLAPPEDGALLQASLVVPAIGLALVLPLSLHLVFFSAWGEPPTSFDDWAQLSALCVGFAHLVFAILFARRARQLASTATPRITIRAIFGWTVLASTIPGFLLFALPVLLTVVTGLFVLPVLYGFDQIAARERNALPVLPRAKVV